MADLSLLDDDDMNGLYDFDDEIDIEDLVEGEHPIIPKFDKREVDEFWAKAGYDFFFPDYPDTYDSPSVYKAHAMLLADQPLDKKDTSMTIVKGKSFDVVSLLCGGGGGSADMDTDTDTGTGTSRDYLVRIGNGDRVRVESLMGKHIVICCFFLPIEWCDINANAIAYAAAELDLKTDDVSPKMKKLKTNNNDQSDDGGGTVITVGGKDYDVEFVVVAKMRSRFDNDDPKSEAFFNQFMSAFPNCLMIPFADKQRRDHVCKSLGFNYLGQAGLILDPSQIVLRKHVGFFGDMGLRHAFPFDDFRKPDFYDYRNRCRAPYPSLEVLLDLQLNDILYKYNTNDKEAVKMDESIISISVLREKVVGLFLVYHEESRDFLDVISHVQQDCRQQKLEFEIVLVYCPCCSYYDLKVFQDRIHKILAEQQITSWWVLPFNNSVSRRLTRYCSLGPKNKLLIVGPRGEYADPIGLEIMSDFGVYAYPFTRKSLFYKELKRVSDLTVDSLFERSKGYLLHHDRGQVQLSDFPRKNVAIYVGHLPSLDFFKHMVVSYQKIKTEDLPGFDFEVIFVCLSGSAPEEVNKLVDVMPWYVCPFEPQHSADVCEKIFRVFERAVESVISFGEAGQICSLTAQWYISGEEPSHLFSGDLCREVMELLDCSTFFSRGYFRNGLVDMI